MLTLTYTLSLTCKRSEKFCKEHEVGKLAMCKKGTLQRVQNKLCKVEVLQISLYNNDQEKRNIEYLNIQDEGGTNEIITKVTSKIINQLNEINSISRTNIPISL